MDIHRQSLVSSSLVSSETFQAFSDVHLNYIATLLVIVLQPVTLAGIIFFLDMRPTSYVSLNGRFIQ